MKRWWIVLLILALVGGSVWFLFIRNDDQASVAADDLVTAEIERGDIEAVVSATGSVAVDHVQSLAFSVAGQVTEVLIAEGDDVNAGQVLARLDSEDALLSLKQAEAALKVSQAQLARAQVVPTQEEIDAAQAAVTSAEAALEALLDGPSARDIELSRLQIDQAKNSLWAAQGSRDAIVGSRATAPGQKDEAKARVLNAEVSVKVAELQHQQLLEPASAREISAAEAQIEQAQANLAKLLTLPSLQDIRVAEAQVAQAQVNVELARARLNDLTLYSPFAGHLSRWDLYVGDTVSPGGPLGTLLDNALFHIDVRIDETEVGDVALGQRVNVLLDAYRDQELTGTVASIALAGENTLGIVTYAVTIEISDSDLPIRPLMTAAVEIVTDVRSDVVLVPNRALRRDAQGTYVELPKFDADENPLRAYLQLGVGNEVETEVQSGLASGQRVIVLRPREAGFGPFGG